MKIYLKDFIVNYELFNLKIKKLLNFQKIKNKKSLRRRTPKIILVVQFIFVKLSITNILIIQLQIKKKFQ